MENTDFSECNEKRTRLRRHTWPRLISSFLGKILVDVPFALHTLAPCQSSPHALKMSIRSRHTTCMQCVISQNIDCRWPHLQSKNLHIEDGVLIGAMRSTMLVHIPWHCWTLSRSILYLKASRKTSKQRNVRCRARSIIPLLSVPRTSHQGRKHQ